MLQSSSVIYANSSVFVEELNNCAADLQRYMTWLALSIKAVVNDLALVIVGEAYREVTPPGCTPGGNDSNCSLFRKEQRQWGRSCSMQSKSMPGGSPGMDQRKQLCS